MSTTRGIHCRFMMKSTWRRAAGMMTLAIAFGLGAGTTACQGGAAKAPAPAVPSEPAGPALSVEPQAALLDVPLAIRVSGLQPGERVTLRAATDAYGSPWSATADFVADGSGAIDVGAQAPVAGSYAVPDAMGLVWSLAPETSDWQLPFVSRRTLEPGTLRFTVERNGTAVASARASRLQVSTEVERHEIRREGLVGTLFVPHGRQARPGIIALGGSEGGLSERTAAILASHGYATLALAYFAHSDLPKSLYGIPLEYFGKAIDFMKGHPSVNGERLGVVGISRGGELALLLGATFPAIKGVVAYVPSGVMWPGLDNARPPGSSWTRAGKPLPFVGSQPDAALQAEWMRKMQAGEAIEVTPMFRAAMKNKRAMAAAEIPVEKTQGAILMISGKNDAVWPSTDLAEIAMQRLRKHKHPHPYEHLAYDDAGHLIFPPYRPTTIAALTHPQTKVALAFGGTPLGNARACAESWRRVLEFFATALR